MLSFTPPKSRDPLRIVLALAVGLAAGCGMAGSAEADTTLCIGKKSGKTRISSSCTVKETAVVIPSAPATFDYKIGDTGPGGGIIFFVDYHDQYPGFTYLEAAPADVAGTPQWCNDTSTSIPAVNGWAASAVGRGQANTTAMLAVCTSGAANAADDYISPNATVDWFLPSEGELMLMYTNLRQAGLGGFGPYGYWSSSEYVSFAAWYQYFPIGYQDFANKNGDLGVRPARAF
jgi:hypothetical protein